MKARNKPLIVRPIVEAVPSSSQAHQEKRPPSPGALMDDPVPDYYAGSHRSNEHRADETYAESHLSTPQSHRTVPGKVHDKDALIHETDREDEFL